MFHLPDPGAASTWHPDTESLKIWKGMQQESSLCRRWVDLSLFCALFFSSFEETWRVVLVTQKETAAIVSSSYSSLCPGMKKQAVSCVDGSLQQHRHGKMSLQLSLQFGEFLQRKNGEKEFAHSCSLFQQTSLCKAKSGWTTGLPQAWNELQGIVIAVWKDFFSLKSQQGNGRVWP